MAPHYEPSEHLRRVSPWEGVVDDGRKGDEAAAITVSRLIRTNI
jgi:hypothetical protein